MTQPVTSPSTPQAFISEVGQYDKRAQESLQQALDTLQKQANTLQQAHALTRTITHLQQCRP